jgi:hypothetical protein
MAVTLVPGSASASTCSDYSNQAEAQRVHDTRDSDGDGIYCESLKSHMEAALAKAGADPGAQPARRRRAPGPAVGEHPNPRGV